MALDRNSAQTIASPDVEFWKFKYTFFYFLKCGRGDVTSELTDLECTVSVTKINAVNWF